MQELGLKFKIHDPDLEQATLEIWNGIQPHLGAEEEDDGFETVSEDSDEEMMVEWGLHIHALIKLETSKYKW